MDERLIGKGLERWFCCNIVADFCQQSCRNVAYLVVADSWNAAHVADHSMIHREGGATIA